VTHNISGKLRPYLFFTSLNTVSTLIPKDSKSLLDIGCGKSEPMQFLNRSRIFYTLGLDIFKPYLKISKARSIHDDYILCDVTQMPLQSKSMDVALCTEVLEHLDRALGEKLLKVLEETTRKEVIITSPVGEYEQSAYDENPYQAHRHIWCPDELSALGYRVIGIGLRNIGGDQGPFGRTKRTKPIGDLLWVLAGPITHFIPSLAGDMVCAKTLPETK